MKLPSLLPSRIPVHLGFRTLRRSQVCAAEVARKDVDQQRHVAVLVRWTEQVVVLARVQKPLGDLDLVFQSWESLGPLLICESVCPLKDAAHEAVQSRNNASSHHLKDESGFEDTNRGMTLPAGRVVAHRVVVAPDEVPHHVLPTAVFE